MATTTPLSTAPGTKVFLLLFLQKKKSLFFSEEKNQKTFIPRACSNIRDLAGNMRAAVRVSASPKPGSPR
jgi:hypothetical protein